MSAFEQIVRDSLGRIEEKVDKLSEAHSKLETQVALADQRHGIIGSVSGAASGALSSLAAFFISHRH